MADVKITFNDGTVVEHKDKGRSGGSYTQTIRYEGVFVIVKDCWGAETSYPAANISKVEKESTQRDW